MAKPALVTLRSRYVGQIPKNFAQRAVDIGGLHHGAGRRPRFKQKPKNRCCSFQWWEWQGGPTQPAVPAAEGWLPAGQECRQEAHYSLAGGALHEVVPEHAVLSQNRKARQQGNQLALAMGLSFAEYRSKLRSNGGFAYPYLLRQLVRRGTPRNP
jgi:hypothetical protein